MRLPGCQRYHHKAPRFSNMSVKMMRGLLSFIVLILILFFSWFVAVLFDYYTGHGKILKPHRNTDSPPFPGDQLERVFWFLQISDIHISQFRDLKRAEDLKQFCTENIDVIKPVAVLVTGDLTDAKDTSLIFSKQYKEEWEVYHRVLKETRVEDKTEWLDIRGNHDAFGVPTLESEENYFKLYSSSGSDVNRGSSTYQRVFTTDYGKYAFNGIDTCPNPGLRRPFNFFGHIDPARVEEMETMAKKSKDFNVTIWFGHHPFSVLTAPSLRRVLRYGTVYLCGHLHTMGGTLPKMHAVHADGHVELELGDWLDARNYRVMAVDHDMFSFVDVQLNTWPVILVTNPKDAHYIMKAHEPLGRMRRSTHIRVLIFSPVPIKSVRIEIDGKLLESNAVHSKGPLYACKWNAELYSTGIHQLTVKVQDQEGRMTEKTQLFSLDGSRPSLKLIPAIILLTDFTTLGCVTFCSLFLFVVVSFIHFRRSTYAASGILRSLLGRWRNRLILLSQTDCVFYPLFSYVIYVALGPWFIGEVTEGDVGAMFVHGLYVNGHWIPGSLTWYYGILQVLLFNIPLALYLAHNLESHDPVNTPSEGPQVLQERHCCSKIKTHVGFLVMLSWQASSSFRVWHAYGLMAFLLSPVKTWSLPFALLLVWKVHHVTLK